MIGQTISHYKILEKLGGGGMGVVYKAEDLTLDRHVALKFLPHELSANEAAKTRFIREAKAASALEHPNICNIHEIAETPDGSLFMVMPCYEGETLRDRLEKGPLEIDEALDVAVQVASGLVRAHEKGIVHRDIKPGNVMLTDEGRHATLMDFGLAKKLDTTKMTQTGMTVGTVAYMSPEQALGKETDARTDVWSLGVMLYEMLTGRLPFQGDVEPAVVYSIINEEPEAVSASRRDVPVEIENIVDKAITKNVADRYQTMEKFLTALEEQREELKLGIKGRGLLTMRRKVRQRLLRISISAVLIIAAVVSIIIFQPFEIEIRPKTKEAIARENSIVVLPFENLMDPTDADNDAYAITSLLTTGLRESEYMQVVSSERLYDVLRQLGEEDQRVVSREVKEEVAKRTGSSWILTGKLYQTEPNLVVSAEITNAVTGERRAGWDNVRGKMGEDVFRIVDKLKAEIGKELALPEDALEELDRSVSEVTTNSPEAYRYFIEGILNAYKYYREEARENFQKAIEHDSTFAAAYLMWASMSGLLSLDEEKRQYWPEVKENFEKAREYSEKLGELQKLLLEAQAAWMLEREFVRAREISLEISRRDPQDKLAWSSAGDFARILGQHKEAIGYYQKAIELDSIGRASAFGWMALSYGVLGDLENAVSHADEYLSLAPDVAQSHFVRAQVYLAQGNTESAIEEWETADRIKPGYETLGLGRTYILARQYERAESLYHHVIMGPQPYWRSAARFGLACIPMYQGRLDQALKILDEGITADRLEKQRYWDKIIQKARIYLHQNKMDHARREIETAVELSNGHSVCLTIQAYMLSLGGRIAEAEKIAETLRTKLEGKNEGKMWSYWWSKGMIELAKGKPDSAVVHLKLSADLVHRHQMWMWNALPVRTCLVKALLEAGQPDDAVREVETALSVKYVSDKNHLIWAAKVHYIAGLAYEQAGRNDEAIARYEEFLDIWKDADPDLDAVPDARRRLALLKAN